MQAAGLQQIRSGPTMRSRIIELQQSKSLPDHVICARALEKPDPVTIILSTTAASSDSLIDLLF
jgi:hypothetical protein